MKKKALPKEDKVNEIASPMPAMQKIGKFDKYHVENALRTVKEAQVHMADPELMHHVKKMAKDERQALGKIADIPSDDEDSVEAAQEEFDKKPSTKGLRKLASKKAGA